MASRTSGPAIWAELDKIIQFVQRENKGAVENWIAGLDQKTVRERVKAWKQAQSHCPSKVQVKEMLGCEDEHVSSRLVG